MGCGSSRAKGRDNYGLLEGDPEPFTPLVRAEPEDPPRLDSFLTELEASRNLTDDSSPVSSQQRQKKVEDIFAPFTLSSFDTSNREILSNTTSTAPTSTNYTNTTNTTRPNTGTLNVGTTSKATPSLAYSAASNQQYHSNSSNNSSNNNSNHIQTNPESTSKVISEHSSNSAFPDLRGESSAEVFGTTTFDSSDFGSSFTASVEPQQTIQSKPNPVASITTSVVESSQSIHTENTTDPSKLAKKVVKKKKRKPSIKETPITTLGSSATIPTTAPTKPTQLGMHMDTPEPSSGSGQPFDDLYRLKGVLGTGAFSTVREGCHRSSTSITYAVKCVNRKKLSEEDEAALLDEVSILKQMKHEYIIRLYDFFSEPATYYLVMERMSGGELFDRIVAKAYYSEKEARDVCKIVLEAVAYLHDNNVAHRDLKPENLLLLSESDDSQVKIADFGFAKKVVAPQSLTTQCGTPGYVAPEILEGTPYDTRADMWSVGVILYILLGGYPPFIENNQRDLFRKIRRGEYEFHEEYWGTVSSDAKNLISSLLTVDIAKRLDADQALDNQWICADDGALAKRDLGTNLKKLSTYNVKRKFKAAVSTVMAVNKLKSLGEDFYKNLS